MSAEKELQIIPDEDFVFRNIHFTQYKQWNPKRRPNETDFKFDADGMSVSWERYCDLIQVFLALGLSKNTKGNYRNPQDFKAIKLNVGDLRNLALANEEKLDVKHAPTPENFGHSLVCCSKDEVIDEIRLKLCDMVEAMETPLHQPDLGEVNKILEIERDKLG